MKLAVAFLLAVIVMAVAACGGEQLTATPAPTATPIPTATAVPTPTLTPTLVPTATPIPTPTLVPTATPDVAATVQAGVEATRTAEAEIEARIQSGIDATRAAIPPTPTSAPATISLETISPETISTEGKLAREFFDCLESNLAVAGAFTSSYDGPLSGRIQTVLNAAGDITSLLHDLDVFTDAMLLAMDANPLVAPSVLAINVGCALIGGDGDSGTPDAGETPTPTPEPTLMPTSEPEDGSNVPKCEGLVPQIIELSQDMGSSDIPIVEITDIQEISDNLLGFECQGLSHTQDGESKWIKFQRDRLGRYGYEMLKPGDYECEYLVAKVIELSRGHDQEILEVNEIQELQQDDDELLCEGIAKLSSGESAIRFSLTEQDDGQLAYRLDIGSTQ